MTSEEEAEPNNGSELPESVIADLRADGRRRRVLDRLAESERPLPVSDLARRVAAAEEAGAVEEVSRETADPVRRDIFQRHLPKLTATGVVRYDSLLATVELAVDDERLFGDDVETKSRASSGADGE
ncbi:hypothetical protein [Halosimplex sp. TS25]|uniref:DUF7344 domain-containing protein n=1 Tax=Halosimplex rarum TaxID=3396619 RepID=UPI0039EC5DF6